MDVIGLENVPEEGAAILVTNHIHLLDPALVFMLLDRDDSTAFVARKHQENPILRSLVNTVSGVWINRQEADLKAFKEALGLLRRGWIFGIAPEGTRSQTSAMIPAKEGVAYLVDKARAPVMPVAISGTENTFHKLAHFCQPRIRIQFGELFSLPPLDRRDREKSMQHNTDEIMYQIAAMLPPEYRGVYTENSRLKEILVSQGRDHN
jgi:1-acyl-sn-glycerol-3-phosphate acyltransferase